MNEREQKLADAILNAIDEYEGRDTFDVEVILDDETCIWATGTYEFDGYREEDTYFVHGGYFITNTEISINDYGVFVDGKDDTTQTLDTRAIELYLKNEYEGYN